MDEFKNARLDPSWTSYVADPSKLKEEFVALSTALTTALVNMRLSGNGDGPVSEEDSFNVFASYFGPRYCRGDIPLFYAYTVLFENQLLESSTSEMPMGTKANSSSSPKCGDLNPDQKVSGGRNKGSLSTGDGLVSIALALEKPISFSTTADDDDAKAEKAAKRAHAETMSEGAKIELSRMKEEESGRTQRAIDDILSDGREPPGWMLKKLQKLNSDLELQWA